MCAQASHRDPAAAGLVEAAVAFAGARRPCAISMPNRLKGVAVFAGRGAGHDGRRSSGSLRPSSRKKLPEIARPGLHLSSENSAQLHAASLPELGLAAA